MEVGKIYHVSLDIMSACEWPKSRLRKLLVNTATGRMLTSDEARRVLLQHLSEGRKFLPTGDCEGFDYQTGCPGHEELP